MRKRKPTIAFEKNWPLIWVIVAIHHKPPVLKGRALGQFYFIADSDRTYLQLWIDNCFKFIRHPEVELRFFNAWHVRICKTKKMCLKVFILYTFPVQLHLETVCFQIFWSRNESWYFARRFKKDMNNSNPLKISILSEYDFSMYFALYLKIKNADFTGGLWWTVTIYLKAVFWKVGGYSFFGEIWLCDWKFRPPPNSKPKANHICDSYSNQIFCFFPPINKLSYKLNHFLKPILGT